MKQKKKKKTSMRVGIIAGSIVGAILILILVASAVLIHYIGKINYVPLVENYTINTNIGTQEEDVTNPEDVTGVDSSDKEISEYQKAVNEAIANRHLKYEDMDNIINILLIGLDTRTPGGGGRSDTMLLISINQENKRVVATSFLRDLYVNIPNVGYDKLNAAYAYGGVELLLDTIDYNFSIAVDKYITVDFYSFVEVADILGGLDIDVQEDELYWLNQYIHASNLLLNEPEHDGYLDYADGSMQHLSGKQVLAYSRFRYVGNGDFTRTERQRKVVYLLFEKIRSIDVSTLIELMDTILPQITSNITTVEFLELIAILPQLSSYDIISWGVPDEDFQYLTINGQSHIGIDFDYYINKIYGLVNTEETYNLKTME